MACVRSGASRISIAATIAGLEGGVVLDHLDAAISQIPWNAKHKDEAEGEDEEEEGEFRHEPDDANDGEAARGDAHEESGTAVEATLRVFEIADDPIGSEGRDHNSDEDRGSDHDANECGGALHVLMKDRLNETGKERAVCSNEKSSQCKSKQIRG